MELTEQQEGIERRYLGDYDRLIGDARTRRTFRAVIEGIIGGESMRAVSIARFSPRDGKHQMC
jgi:hypothetical protein